MKAKGDHVLSNLERQRAFQDRACNIDAYLEEKYSGIDWNRRNAAEKGGLVEWAKVYGIGLTLDDAPPPLGEDVLGQMDKAITGHSNFAIAMGRGAGKSAYSITCAIYALATGIQRFVVIMAANARASNGLLADIYRAFQVPDSKFAIDYPEIVSPFIIANGSFKRRQLFGGVSTNISKTADTLILATYNDPRFQRASGSLVVTRSITGGIRGLRRFTMRPSFCIIDDIQTTESAHNPEQVEKLLETIRKDIIPLAGKERISLLQCFTQICPDDLVEKIKADKSWHTTIYPTIIKYPDRLDLWEKYLTMYYEEFANGDTHEESLSFYKQNQQTMDKGAQVFNPSRFSVKDGHISAIQKWMQLRHEIGEANFDAEYQQQPHSLQYALPISNELVCSRISPFGFMEIPKENLIGVFASSDLNLSKYITTTICAFLRDHTCHIIYHTFKKCAISSNIPESEYYSKVYNLLGEHGRELKQLCDRHKVKLNGWAIDQNGLPWKAVSDFCHNSFNICGISACGFVGKASHQFHPFIKTRLKEAVNRTLLVGDEDERKVAGSGRKWIYFDSDLFHEKVQKGFIQEQGNSGSIMFYHSGEHGKFALQICSEKLIMKKHRTDGEYEYTWRSIGADHDYLDALGQCLAAFAAQGFATDTTGRIALNMPQRTIRKKRRYKIV